MTEVRMEGGERKSASGTESLLPSGQFWAEWFNGLHSAGRGTSTRRALVRAKHYVDRRFSEPVALDLMAARAHLSKYHFVRAFRNIFRRTPHRYLIARRIARAGELLERTDLSVTAICFEVGFESLGSFSKRFKQLVGEPPGRYGRRFAKFGAIANRPMPACLYEARSARTPRGGSAPQTAISERRGSERRPILDVESRADKRFE